MSVNKILKPCCDKTPPLGTHLHTMHKTTTAMQKSATDSGFMALAIEQAKLAASENEVPVGAVLVYEGRVIATGRNSPISGADPTAHAEINALRTAGQHVKNYRLENCTLYVTLEPCPMCMGAILQARISEVIFCLSDPKMGACGSVLNLAEEAKLNAHTQVRQSHELHDACKTLLQSFFRSRRRDPTLRLNEIAQLEDLPNVDKVLVDLMKRQGITSPLHLHAYTNQPPETMLEALTVAISGPKSAEMCARIKAVHHFIAGGAAISWKDLLQQENGK